MDRTIIVPYRAEEKELSHILYNAIQGLILIYPPTEDLRKCLSDEMFIKPNQQAFFQIMHYLFRLYDPQEFKKRFFWPITDKRSESNFRTSTVEYLKHINEKFQLNWTYIKSYLVVMPGGMKFISFLLDLINFIVQELIKQKEKQLNLEAGYRSQVSEENLQKLCAKNEFFKGMTSEFIDTIENLNAKYDEKGHKLWQQLKLLSQECGTSVDLLTDEKFLKSFEEDNYQLFDQYYIDRSKKVLGLDNSISELKESMEIFFSKESGYKYDKQNLCEQLNRIQDHYPIDELLKESSATKVSDDGVNINTLISTFNAISETIQNQLKMCNKKPPVDEFVFSRLLNLKKELQEMETQITNLKKILNENMKKSVIKFPKTPTRDDINYEAKRNLENTLLMKLVSTPPIKFEMPVVGGTSRLALVDSMAPHTNGITFNNFLAPSRPSAIRQTNRHQSLMDLTVLDLNNSLNRSKIIDPMQLLRSTSKKDPSKHKASTASKIEISSLGTKWKLRQSILDENAETPTVSEVIPTIAIDKISPQSCNKTNSTTMLQQSLFTPFSSNDHTKISRIQYKTDSNTLNDENSSESPSLNCAKKLLAVKKVQNASLNYPNLSTSPSGRLEPLVTVEDLQISKLPKLNDVSLIENLTSNNFFVYENTQILINSPNITITIHNESDTNINKTSEKSVNNPTTQHNQEDDALFNTSDSVLKDLIL